MAYTVDQYGISGFVRMRRRKTGSQPTNLDVNSVGDTKPIRLNSRDFTTDTGDAIGVQCKPNQTTTMTNRSVKGAEFSPRVTDAGLGSSGALIALTADPVLKTATSARTVGSVRCLEMNPSFPGSGSAYTVTNLDAIRIFIDTGVGHTITTKSIIRIAAPNAVDWDYLVLAEQAGAWAVVSSGTYSTAEGYFVVKVGSNVYRVPFFTGTD